MYHLGVFLLLGLVCANDLAVGPSNVGKKIYEQKNEASPAIWRQKLNVTINATDEEVINSINIVDLRPEKDGEANIVDGGIGHPNVTIELKSPAVFRGFYFQIEVFAVPKSEFKGVLPEQKTSTAPATEHPFASNTDVPILTAVEADNTRPARNSDTVQSNPDGLDVKNTVSSTTTNPEDTTKTNVLTPEMPETNEPAADKALNEAFDEVITIPKHEGNSNEDGSNVPRVFINEQPPSTSVVVESTSVMPTTDVDAQTIVIGGQNPTNTGMNPVTHEEQDTKKGLYTHPSQVPVLNASSEKAIPNPAPVCSDCKGHEATTDLNQPHPMEQTENTLLNHDNIHTTTTVPQVTDNNSKYPSVDDHRGLVHGHEYQGFREQQNFNNMKPLPYVNH